MTIQQELERPQRRQRKLKRKRNYRKTLSLKERERRRRQRSEERQRVQSITGHIVVFPFRDWCTMRGVSVATGRRLAEAGRVKITQLSARRIGVRSDHDLQYLDSCLRDGA
jgi:hypothetical protein